MDVGELKKMLEKYPDDMRVISTRMSDYDIVDEGDWSIVKGVPKSHYIMRSHPTMNADNKAKEEEFLHLYGN